MRVYVDRNSVVVSLEGVDRAASRNDHSSVERSLLDRANLLSLAVTCPVENLCIVNLYLDQKVIRAVALSQDRRGFPPVAEKSSYFA